MIDAELLRAVIRGDADAESHLVLADALSASGDPRGELVALQSRRATTRDIEDLDRVTAREREVLAETDLWGRYDPEWMSAEWRLGWIRDLAFRIEPVKERFDEIGALLDHASYQGVHTLLIEAFEEIDATVIANVFAERAIPLHRWSYADKT